MALPIFPSKNLFDISKIDLSREKAISQRVISFLGACLFFIFTTIDYFALPQETLAIVIPVRAVTIALLLGLCYLTFFPFFVKKYTTNILAGYVIAVTSIIITVSVAEPNHYSYNLYFAAFMIVIMTNFTLSFLSLGLSVITCFLISIIYVWTKLVVHDISETNDILRLLAQFLYLNSAMMMGLIAQGSRYFLIKKQFELQKKVQDFADIKAHEARKNKKLANIDEMTGIPNRRFILEKLKKELNENDTSLTLVFLDLDSFKEINDTFGHDSGDAVLKTTAKRLDRLIRKNDFVARLGGDEFLLGCTESKGSRPSLEEIDNRIKTTVMAPIAYNGNLLQVGVSIGFAIYPDDGSSIDELMRVADANMYHEKQKNKKRPTSIQSPA